MLLALDAANERNHSHNCQHTGRPEEQSFRMFAQVPLTRRLRVIDPHGLFPWRSLVSPKRVKTVQVPCRIAFRRAIAPDALKLSMIEFVSTPEIFPAQGLVLATFLIISMQSVGCDHSIES